MSRSQSWNTSGSQLCGTNALTGPSTRAGDLKSLTHVTGFINRHVQRPTGGNCHVCCFILPVSVHPGILKGFSSGFTGGRWWRTESPVEGGSRDGGRGAPVLLCVGALCAVGDAVKGRATHTAGMSCMQSIESVSRGRQRGEGGPLWRRHHGAQGLSARGGVLYYWYSFMSKKKEKEKTPPTA